MSEDCMRVIWLIAFLAVMVLGAYWAIKLYRYLHKPTLRKLCWIEYGDEFIRDYDTLNNGGVIGGWAETITFINMVEDVKEKYEGEWR